MKKKFLLILLFLVMVTFLSFAVEDKDIKSQVVESKLIIEEIENLDLSDLEREIRNLSSVGNNMLTETSLKDIILDFVQGEINFNLRAIIKTAVKLLGQELKANISILAQVIFLAVISSILSIFSSSLTDDSISKAVNMLIFLILAILLMQSFKIAINIGVEVTDNVTNFMQALMPLMLSLLAGMGAISSAAMFQPTVFVFITFFASLVKYVVLPLFFISLVLKIMNNINESIDFSRLAGLLKEIAATLLILCFVVLNGALLFQGGAMVVTDSLTLRAAKFLSSTFIPILGGYFSDALELVVSCSLLLKNALTFFGIFTVFLVFAYPIVKLIALIALYKITAALIQPLANNERLVNVLDEMGNSLVLVFLTTLAMTFLAVITLTIVVGAANLIVMMR
ncbi:MAG: stage III sporulation protein AE [bacterium]